MLRRKKSTKAFATLVATKRGDATNDCLGVEIQHWAVATVGKGGKNGKGRSSPKKKTRRRRQGCCHCQVKRF